MKPKYAGFWIRFLADILDTVVLEIGTWIVDQILRHIFYYILAGYKSHMGEIVPSFEDAFHPFAVQLFGVGIYLLLAFPYYVLGHYRYGTTLGKKPFGIYVVAAEGLGPITLKQSVIRFCAYLPSYVIFFTGFIMAAFQPEKRALHDLLAGTVSILGRPKPSEVASAAVSFPEPEI